MHNYPVQTSPRVNGARPFLRGRTGSDGLELHGTRVCLGDE